LIVKQILLISVIGNVWRTVWRIYKLISVFKGKLQVESECHRSHNRSHASHKEKTKQSLLALTLFQKVKKDKKKNNNNKKLGMVFRARRHV